ncbi:MAG: hypothetical protein DRJ51_06310 [Thermoprotei archaeon]|nr:MAG: hypothetical protein DRJ51_06310 [Thermoprotei archaeon]
MRYKWNRKEIFAHILMVFINLVVLIPLYFLVITAFKPYEEIIRVPPTFWPKEFTLENFYSFAALRGVNLLRALANSFAVSAMVTLGTVFFSTLAGYTFAMLRFRFKEAIFIIILTKYMLPTAILLIPWYWIMRTLRLIDTLLAVAIVNIIGAWTIYYMRSYISQIPKDYVEAARIEGANDLQIFTRIIMPIVKPALGTATIINFLWSWNYFLWPLIILNSKENFTMPIVIAFVRYVGYGGGELLNYGGVAASSLVYALPIILLYTVLQRYIVESFVASGIKR